MGKKVEGNNGKKNNCTTPTFTLKFCDKFEKIESLNNKCNLCGECQ